MKLVKFAIIVAAQYLYSDQVVSAPKKLRIGSFNVLRLGHGSKDMKRLTKIVIKANFDLFAAIEVMNKPVAYDLLKRLKKRSSAEWDLVLSKTSSGESSYKEYFAVYYKKSLFAPDQSDSAYCSLKNYAKERLQNGCYALDRNKRFYRDPYITHFKVNGKKLTILAVHIFYGSKSLAHINKRKREVTQLRKIARRIKRKTRSNVIILGDFNLPKKVLRNTFHRSNVLVSKPTTIWDSVYDNIIFANNRQFYLVPGSVRVVRDYNKRSKNARKLYLKKVSDHLPVVASFRF